jgi:hypothetical protein
MGFDVLFVLDPTHAFESGGLSADELARATAANLHGEFATVVATADLVGGQAAVRDAYRAGSWDRQGLPAAAPAPRAQCEPLLVSARPRPLRTRSSRPRRRDRLSRRSPFCGAACVPAIHSLRSRRHWLWPTVPRGQLGLEIGDLGAQAAVLLEQQLEARPQRGVAGSLDSLHDGEIDDVREIDDDGEMDDEREADDD